MTVTQTITIDRSSLSLADLDIESENLTDYTLMTIVEPEVSPRVSTARSAYVHGDLVTGYTLDTSTLVLAVRVSATTTASLENKCQALRRAVSRQVVYTLTRELDGETQVWTCQPGGITRQGIVDKSEVSAHFAEYLITIPVYPIFGS